MMHFLKLGFSIVLFTLVSVNLFGQITLAKPLTLMGSRFDITVNATDSAQATEHINAAIAEIVRIENLISDWKTDSQISKVNSNAGIAAVKVDAEVFLLTKRALAFSEITDGAFDISFAAMDKIWRFDGAMSSLPTEDVIKNAIAKVNYKRVQLDSLNSTIFLMDEGMKIGFGATGKGYAADRGRAVLEKRGVKGGIVNASGDLSTWGKQVNGRLWQIGIVNPFNELKDLTTLKLNRAAVTTSGSYEKFVMLNGKRYAHIINPKTGYPVTGLTSVTVVGQSAETANALSTATMVIGFKEGLKLLAKFEGYSLLVVDDAGKVSKSKNFKTRF